jgi:dihydropteroate synthase
MTRLTHRIPTTTLSPPARSWRLADRDLELAQPLVAGIVNVTEDSFFSGARSGTPERAVEDGVDLVSAGFDLLDVGAVPAGGGPAVGATEEAERLLPAIEALARRSGVPVSADTFSPEVAIAAGRAGAAAINDIGGGHPEMLAAVAQTGCGYVLMHIEGPPREDRRPPRYDDPVEHLVSWFAARIEAAVDAGIDERRVAIDPGFDFDLTLADDLEVLRRLGELHVLGRPLFVSVSRKDFLGAVLAGSWEERVPAEEREWATCAAATIAVAAGAQVLRLHDLSALDAVRVAGRIADG